MDHQNVTLLGDPRTWVAISFLLFFLIFGRKLVTPLLAILDKRAIEIKRELDEASRLRREAEKMLADATLQRETAMRDAETMLAQAHAEAKHVADAARADATASATRRERMARDRIAAAEKAAVSDVRHAAADLAGRAAELVLATGFTADSDAALIDRAIQQLPAALAGRRAA